MKDILGNAQHRVKEANGNKSGGIEKATKTPRKDELYKEIAMPHYSFSKRDDSILYYRIFMYC